MAQNPKRQARRLQSALGLFLIPAGTQVELPGRTFTTRQDVTFAPSDIVDEDPQSLTVVLHRQDRDWRLRVQRADLQTSQPLAAPQTAAPRLSRDEALEALDALSPATVLVGASNIVIVPSDSDPARTYSVTLTFDNKALDCTCHHFSFRQQRCKHMKRADHIQQWIEAIEALLDAGTDPNDVLEAWKRCRASLGVDGAMGWVIAQHQRGASFMD